MKKPLLTLVCLLATLAALQISRADETNSSMYNLTFNKTICLLSNGTNFTSYDCDNDSFPYWLDCNDSNQNINPNATELCNRLDDNCNGLVDEGFDQDIDGFYPASCGYGTFDCNDSNPFVNPNSTEVFGNGLDDDCNASTPDKPYLRVLITKPSYLLGETGALIVNATQGSYVYLTITTPSSSHNSILSLHGPYPVVQMLPYIRKVGTYIVDASLDYMNYANSTRITFSVENTIAAQIIGSSSVPRNGQLQLSATAAGGIGTLRYYWDFGDSTFSVGSSQTHIYTSVGRRTIWLYVNDSEQNQWRTSKDIDVYDNYRLTVAVRNSSFGVKNAKVELNSDQKLTNDSGLVQFTSLLRGIYYLKVSRSGYEPYLETINLTANLSRIVQLIATETTLPVVTLVAPADGQEFEPGKVQLRFHASDSSNMECVLYLSLDNSWWSKEAVFENVVSNQEYSYALNNPQQTTYWWKVRCQDSDSNAQFSQVFKFIVRSKEAQQDASQDTTIQPVATDDENADLLAQIDTYRDSLAKLPSVEAEAAQLLGLDAQLLDAKKNIQNYGRDIFNVKFRKLTDAEKANLTYDLTQRLEFQKKSIIKNLQVLKHNNFVKYSSSADLKLLVSLLTNSSVTASSLTPLQHLLTVSTKVFVVRLEFLGLEPKILTLVQKSVQISNASQLGSVLEVVPKEFARSASELKVLGVYKVLQDDPVLEFVPNDSLVIQYSVDKEVDPAIVESSITAGLPTTVALSNKVTGFAVGNLSKGIMDNSLYILIIAVLVSVMLLLAYKWEDLSQSFAKVNTPMPREFIVLSQKLIERLNNDNLTSARTIYRELQQEYAKSPKEVKAAVSFEVLHLFHRLQFSELQHTAARIKTYCEDGDLEQAKHHYHSINQMYSKLPRHLKEQAFETCIGARKRIDEN
ncbi:MAG: MopE-related protein [Candidatus Woesearchaeota archaeon]